MSFPFSAIKSLSAVNPPVLTFGISGTSLLEKIVPNVSLIMRYVIDRVPRELEGQDGSGRSNVLPKGGIT